MFNNSTYDQQKARRCAITCSTFYFVFIPFILNFIVRSLLMSGDPKLAAITPFWLAINLTFWGTVLLSILISLSLMWRTYLKGFYRKSREIFWAIPMVTFGALLVPFYAIPVLLFSFTDLVSVLKGP